MIWFVYMMMQQMQGARSRRESDRNAVRLDAFQMPSFTGRVGEDLYRYIDQLSHFLENYVRPTEWVVRLKAALQKNQRAFDSVMETERTSAYLLRTETDQYGRTLPPSRVSG